MCITLTVWVTIELNKNECAIEKDRVVQLSSTSKMNLLSKTDRKLTQNNPYSAKFHPPPPPPPPEDTYNPLTVKDFLSAKSSSAGRAEAGERGKHAWLGTAKKNSVKICKKKTSLSSFY